MERIVIIDHDSHTLFIEDLDEDELEKKYGGEEEEYIKDNYNLGKNWSWEFITRIEYYPCDYQDPIELEPKDLL